MEYQSIHLSTVDSTNSYLKEEKKSGDIKENTMVLADFQDAGRGQGNNKWISDPGQNLLFSWIVNPAFLAVSEQFILSKTVSIALVDALTDLGLETEIKWPNDLICNDCKIGGILIEHAIMGKSIDHSIIGVGINVNQLDFPQFPFAATSIKAEMQTSFEVEEIFRRVVKHLHHRYNQLAVEKSSIDKVYQQRLYRRGVSSMFEAHDQIFEGKIIGVDEVGELRIDVSGEVRTFGFQSIRMLSQPG